MDALAAGAFAMAPWDMINHLAATIPGARAYQHYLSGDLFVLTHINIFRAVIFQEISRNKPSVLVRGPLGTTPDSRHGDYLDEDSKTDNRRNSQSAHDLHRVYDHTFAGM